MATNQIGRIVATTLAVGHIGALVLILFVGSLVGAQEHVITGTVLLACAAGWAMLAAHAALWAVQPQRWAPLPATFMGVAGAGLLVCVPDDFALSALGWVWPPLWLALVARTAALVRWDLHSRSRWLVYALLGVYALAGLGAGYQTVRESIDRRVHSAPGQLIDVGGHRLHLQCAGVGTPTVILESGLGEPGSSWGLIFDAIAAGTRVCVYDRAGRGWSDEAAGRQDGVAVATDLHELLARGQVPAPYVLVGHSTGAQYVRIFAGRYPEEVAGMVLLDGQPAEAFEGLPDYPAFYNRFRRVSGVLPLLARLGVGRLTGLEHSSARHFNSLRNECAALPTALHQARSFQNLGERPLVVVTASVDSQSGWLPLQEAMATLSRNSSHRIVPFTHDALVTDPSAAQTSIQAIRDVVQAVRQSAPVGRGR
jgi:pimeloyl-ACP methyl ester carboxylesterase